MTKEDIEKEADKRYKYPHIVNMDACGHQAFCEGASWMQEQFENNRFSDCIEITRKEMIDKACEWLETQLDNWLVESTIRPFIGKEGINEFRKVMEE